MISTASSPRPKSFVTLDNSPAPSLLCHDQRITLDGAPAEPVGAEAKDMAAKQLALPHEIHRRAAGHAKHADFPLGIVNKMRDS
jgi:hypothetical protein